jgi:hypothetical protein
VAARSCVNKANAAVAASGVIPPAPLPPDDAAADNIMAAWVKADVGAEELLPFDALEVGRAARSERRVSKGDWELWPDEPASELCPDDDDDAGETPPSGWYGVE